MSRAVLDASALLAVLHGERGFEVAMPYLRGGLISAVNFAEVLKKAVERGSDLQRTRLHLGHFHLTIVPFDEAHAVCTADIWPQCKPYGLSAADRACLALGLLQQARVITADQRMQDTDLEVDILMIRDVAERAGKT